jgi:hypothetical protein
MSSTEVAGKTGLEKILEVAVIDSGTSGLVYTPREEL